MTYRIEPRRDGGYDVFVPVQHVPVTIEAKRQIYPFGMGLTGQWFVLGWANHRYPSKEDAAEAIVESLRPAPAAELARTEADAWADISRDAAGPGAGFESRMSAP